MNDYKDKHDGFFEWPELIGSAFSLRAFIFVFSIVLLIFTVVPKDPLLRSVFYWFSFIYMFVIAYLPIKFSVDIFVIHKEVSLSRIFDVLLVSIFMFSALAFLISPVGELIKELEFLSIYYDAKILLPVVLLVFLANSLKKRILVHLGWHEEVVVLKALPCAEYLGKKL